MTKFRVGVPFERYQAIPALNASLLKHAARSPLHFRYERDNPSPPSNAMRLGTAAHEFVLEPERAARDFVAWDRRTEGGAMAPRRGKHWDAFREQHPDGEIITADELAEACAMRDAVRGDPTAVRYLQNGFAEVVLQWELDGRPCKGRIDWLTEVDGEPVLVGLKTARDVRPREFGIAAHRLGYPVQWAWYHDGYEALQGRAPRVVEIVVESAPPHAVVTYVVDDEVLELGRAEYRRLLNVIAQCEASGEWSGPATGEHQVLLPRWAFPNDEDDVTGLGLEFGEEAA